MIATDATMWWPMRCAGGCWPRSQAAGLRTCVLWSAHRGNPNCPPKQRDGICFNLSHSHGLVAVAMARGTDLGVDVEERRHPAPFAITRDSFAPAERSCLEAAVPGDRHGMFYDIWTLKEAYIKGTGVGMLMALDSFAVCPDPPSMVIPSPDRARQRWVLSTWDVGPTHSLSLAVLAQADGVPEVNVVPPPHL